MKQPKPGKDKLVCVTYKNGKPQFTFHITNSRIEDWVGKQVLQNKLNVSDRKLQYMRTRRQIPYSSFGKEILYHLPAIVMMIEQSMFL